MSEQSWRDRSLAGLRQMREAIRAEHEAMRLADAVKAAHLADAMDDLDTVRQQLEAESTDSPPQFSDRRAYVRRLRDVSHDRTGKRP